jgi:glycosyltransferase involved in cell wall biosynthesis
MYMPSVSIITVSYNSVTTISDAIKSVLDQTFPNIEYIVIDGGSTDGTVEIVKSFTTKISKFISEPDNGIYDAINKGIRLATGDIIGILHSDDFFYDKTILEKIAQTFAENDTDAVLGDALFVDPADLSRIKRYYSSKNFKVSRFRFGFMPAHTGFYARRKLFEKYGYYKTDYKIAADFELLLRFFHVHQITYKYLPMSIVSMRTGGVSNRSVFSNLTLNKEIARACRENGVKTNYVNIYSKYFVKMFEFFGNNYVTMKPTPNPSQEGNPNNA